jgi:O-methyltransferase domain
MKARSRLLIAERLVMPGDAPDPAKLFDLVMMVQTDGGVERTEAEFRDLLGRAGLRLERVVETGVEVKLIEATVST